MRLRPYFLLLLLLILGITEADSQSGEISPYRYAYMVGNPEKRHEVTLNLIDPTQPESRQTFTLNTTFTEAGGGLADFRISPDGHWLVLYLSGYPLGGIFRFIDLQTGLVVRDIGRFNDYYDIASPIRYEWSPDSQSFAFILPNTKSTRANVFPEGESEEYGLTLYLYTPAQDALTELVAPHTQHLASRTRYFDERLRLFPKRFVWMPDSQKMTVISSGCIDQMCLVEFDLVEISSKSVINTIGFGLWDPYSAGLFCGLASSPNGRYLAFKYACVDEESVGIYPYFAFHEIFLWDMVENHIMQITTNTNPSATDYLPLSPLPDYTTFYSLLWLNEQSLLIGSLSGQLFMGEGIDEDTFQVRTYQYDLDRHDQQTWFNDLAYESAASVASSKIAYRRQRVELGLEQGVLTTVRKSQSLEIAAFDGDSFQIEHTLPAACLLGWSPDGKYLATIIPEKLDECSPLDLHFRSEQITLQFIKGDNGETTKLPLALTGTRILFGGWIESPQHQRLPEVNFPDGTPTIIPLPTVMPAG